MSVTSWTVAFAKQARADFATWSLLKSRPDVPQCHSLQFLQMSCEKLVKASLCLFGADPYKLQWSHLYIEKNIPLVARQQLAKMSRAKPRKWDAVLLNVRHLAREIERLSPAADDGGRRPDNCEYPWEDAASQIHVPAEHTFTNLRLLNEPAGRAFLKIMHAAIEELA